MCVFIIDYTSSKDLIGGHSLSRIVRFWETVGSVAYNHPIGRKNAAYIPGIVLALVWGLYNPKPTNYQNQNS